MNKKIEKAIDNLVSEKKGSPYSDRVDLLAKMRDLFWPFEQLMTFFKRYAGEDLYDVLFISKEDIKQITDAKKNLERIYGEVSSSISNRL